MTWNTWPPSLPPVYTVPPRGCICPPTSEQTCQNPTCPRKALPSSEVTSRTTSGDPTAGYGSGVMGVQTGEPKA